MAEEKEKEGKKDQANDKENSQLVTFKAGDLIIKEGKEERTMYILKTGRVRVYKTYLGKKLTLGILNAGEVFGELSFFDGQERIASVEAIEDGQAIKIDASKVKQDLEITPTWMKGIFKTVVTRLRETDEKLALLQNKYDTTNATGKATVLVEDIFNEVVRVNKVFRLYFNQFEDGVEADKLEEVQSDLNLLLYGSFVKAEKIFDFYEKNQLIKIDEKDGAKKFSLNIEEIDLFDQYLENQTKADQITFFTRGSLNLMGDIIQIIPSNTDEGEATTPLIEIVDESKMSGLNGYQNFIKELKTFKLASGNPIKVLLTLGDLRQHYRYQTIISIFNLTMD